jgi:class 3 adenylate cyclase
VLICASCGGQNQAGARFCNDCGAVLAATPEREVRKTVTVVFSDVTGSTALGESTDPEALRALLARLHTCLEASEIARAVREAGSALVEHDQPREGREVFVEGLPVLIEPGKDKVCERRYEDEVERPFARDLIRDRYVAASCVVNFGDVYGARA